MIEKLKEQLTLKHLLMLTPLFMWLFIFQIAPLIPTTIRPVIDTSTLPKVEGIFFRKELLYELFPTNDFLTILAAIPYLAHFTIPFIFVPYFLKVEAKPFLFLWYFGLLNTVAVLTHLTFPTAPPWYNGEFGYAPASYDMQGDCGRLKGADSILGFSLFQNIYGNSPVVFGSFPSLHAAWPVLISIYTVLMGVPLSSLKWFYIAWIWWAAVYTKHHFFLDVLGGGVYTVIVVFISAKVFGIGQLSPKKEAPILPVRSI